MERRRKLFKIFHIKKALILSRQQGLRVSTTKVKYKIEISTEKAREEKIKHYYKLLDQKILIKISESSSSKEEWLELIEEMKKHSLTIADIKDYICCITVGE